MHQPRCLHSFRPNRTDSSAVSLSFLLKFAERISDTCTTEQVVRQLIVPATQQQKCKYFELLPKMETAAPTFFVSHCWSAPFRQLVRTLEEYCCVERQLAPMETFLWVDIFSVNQHIEQRDKYQVLRDVNQAIYLAGQTLLCLDGRGATLQRLWCLYELQFTALLGSANKLVTLLPPTSVTTCASVVLDFGVAKCTIPDDRNLLFAAVGATHTSLEQASTAATSVLHRSLTTGLHERSKSVALYGSFPASSSSSLFSKYVSFLSSCGRLQEASVLHQQLLDYHKSGGSEGSSVDDITDLPPPETALPFTGGWWSLLANDAGSEDGSARQSWGNHTTLKTEDVLGACDQPTLAGAGISRTAKGDSSTVSESSRTAHRLSAVLHPLSKNTTAAEPLAHKTLKRYTHVDQLSSLPPLTKRPYLCCPYDPLEVAVKLESSDEPQRPSTRPATALGTKDRPAVPCGVQGQSAAVAGLDLTLEDVQAKFHLTLEQAAASLGICGTTLKRACRRLDVKRWPKRNIDSLRLTLSQVDGHDAIQLPQLQRIIYQAITGNSALDNKAMAEVAKRLAEDILNETETGRQSKQPQVSTQNVTGLTKCRAESRARTNIDDSLQLSCYTGLGLTPLQVVSGSPSARPLALQAPVLNPMVDVLGTCRVLTEPAIPLQVSSDRAKWNLGVMDDLDMFMAAEAMLHQDVLGCARLRENCDPGFGFAALPAFSSAGFGTGTDETFPLHSAFMPHTELVPFQSAALGVLADAYRQQCVQLTHANAIMRQEFNRLTSERIQQA